MTGQAAAGTAGGSPAAWRFAESGRDNRPASRRIPARANRAASRAPRASHGPPWIGRRARPARPGLAVRLQERGRDHRRPPARMVPEARRRLPGRRRPRSASPTARTGRQRGSDALSLGIVSCHQTIQMARGRRGARRAAARFLKIAQGEGSYPAARPASFTTENQSQTPPGSRSPSSLGCDTPAAPSA